MKISQSSIIILLSLTSLLAIPSIVYGRSEYWQQKVSLFDKLPIENNDIVFLGNSITDGGEFAELFENENIKNRGISADVISGVRERLHQVTAGAPRKIFLLIGINDISHNLSVEQIVEQYLALVKEIREQSPTTQLYIQSIMPINNDFGRYKNLRGKYEVINDVNRHLEMIAQNEGAIFIDLTSTLSDSQGKLKKEFTNDGLHLLGKGYKAWTKYIKGYVND